MEKVKSSGGKIVPVNDVAAGGVPFPVDYKPSRLMTVMKKMGGGKKAELEYLSIYKFLIEWRPLCNPESEGAIDFEFFYDGGNQHNTLCRGSFMIGHALTIEINANLQIHLTQVSDPPYKLRVDKKSSCSGYIGDIKMGAVYGQPGHYRMKEQSALSLSWSPTQYYGLPSIIYHLGPDGDKHKTNLEELIIMGENLIDEYSDLLKDHLGKNELTITDALALKYIIGDDEKEQVAGVINTIKNKLDMNTSESIYLGSLSNRLCKSAYRKFIEKEMGMTFSELSTSSTKRF
ncbi:MAG: putative movement protein [Alphanucleorhabdovirus xinjianensis]|uniref:Movement protein n=1 Tax=Xinjiang nucleorhabdovirus TaxID=2824629 RepID=A0AAE8BHK8_9RHAB|nr:MAG: putative movement protein [Xinjiang nucleorhabdovirus]